jgi:hypothetical protein
MFETYVAPFSSNIKSLVDAVGSRKRKVFVSTCKAGAPEYFRSYWDGGSRYMYRAWNAEGQELPIHAYVSGAPGFTPEPKPWLPQAGDVIVRYGTTLGKPAAPSITFYR